ncbi:TIGR03435 family protein [Silvibacterium sp.]|uniref:TIGR03435 family protein n=1 Tax=Silvibacterium sp. TaxID=1964179 RepID=UPI0039E26846
MSCLLMVSAVAQEAAPTALKYDVATVKENKSASQMTMINFQVGDMLQVENATLKIMLSEAFHRHPYLIEGVPKWAESQRFDVQAKILDQTPEQIKALTEDQRRAMFAAVLEERFHLKTHWETREKPEYDLVVAKGGSRLQASTAGGPSSMISPVGLKASGTTVAQLANAFAMILQQQVIDKTGLAGKYDVEMQWAPLNSRGGSDDAPADSTAPSVYTAVKETLGLELKPTHGPEQVLVVDSAEAPTVD